MRHCGKRLLAILFAAIVLTASVPTTAWAEESDETAENETVSEETDDGTEDTPDDTSDADDSNQDADSENNTSDTVDLNQDGDGEGGTSEDDASNQDENDGEDNTSDDVDPAQVSDDETGGDSAHTHSYSADSEYAYYTVAGSEEDSYAGTTVTFLCMGGCGDTQVVDALVAASEDGSAYTITASYEDVSYEAIYTPASGNGEDTEGTARQKTGSKTVLDDGDDDGDDEDLVAAADLSDYYTYASTLSNLLNTLPYVDQLDSLTEDQLASAKNTVNQIYSILSSMGNDLTTLDSTAISTLESTLNLTSGTLTNLQALYNYFNATSSEDEEDDDSGSSSSYKINNLIWSTDRTVSQNENNLGTKNVYYISYKDDLTVDYENTMNMEELEATFTEKIETYLKTFCSTSGVDLSDGLNDDEKLKIKSALTNSGYSGNYDALITMLENYEDIDAWEILKGFYTGISDETIIYLKYSFGEDSGVDLSSVTASELASQITLTSDMFSFSQTAEDININTETNTLIITCYWDSDKASENMTGKGTLDPMIYISGIELPITSNWDDSIEGYECVDNVESLTIDADGSVYGTMVTSSNSLISLILGGGNSVEIDGGTAEDSFKLVIKKTFLTVNIEWDDADDYDKLRPGSTSVTLYQTYTYKDEDGSLATGIRKVDYEDVTATVTVSANGNWTYTYSDLPAYDEYGNAITYSVSQESIEKYCTEDTGVTGSIDEGFEITFTNTHIPKTSVSVSKSWSDSDDQDGIRPSSVTVTVYANGESVGTLTLSGGNNWSDTLEDLQRFVNNDASTPYTFTIAETAVSGYSASISELETKDNNYAFAVTNSHTASSTATTTTAATGALGIVKVDAETGERLAGATFALYNSTTGTMLGYYTTDSNGYLQTSGLTLNYTYSFVEVTAPDGYILDSTAHSVTLTSDLSSSSGSPYVMTISNTAESSVLTEERDIETGETETGETETGEVLDAERGSGTGDDSNLLLWIALLLAAGAGLAGCIVYFGFIPKSRRRF